MHLIHQGIFYSQTGVKWEVRIFRDQPSAPAAVGSLHFPADEPLLIEWDECGKEAPICSSTATLKLISPGDRTYIDLYTVAPGGIRLDVLRQNQLYWSGTLDPELYEEPYAMLDSYEVQLTFADFGILDRLNYDLSGIVPLDQLVSHALQLSAINLTDIDTSLISSSIPGAAVAGGQQPAALSLGQLSVVSDNFYDEDGDPLKFKEVIEGILQPLALKMIQRGGKVWIFDLNGLYSLGSMAQLRWMSDDQQLGTDRVVNNAKVTWSPYVGSGNLAEEECFVKGTDPNVIAFGDIGRYSGSCRVWSYHRSTEVSEWTDDTDSGFSLWTATEGKNATLCDANLRFFKIVPQQDGDAAEGVAILWPGVSNPVAGSSTPHFLLFGHGESANQNATGWTNGYRGGPARSALWKSSAISIPPVHNPTSLRLRITIDMLMDCRFNPFEEAADMGNCAQKNWYDKWRSRGNFVYVPVSIKFQSAGSGNIYCWTNQSMLLRPIDHPARSLDQTMGDTSRTDPSAVQGWRLYDAASESNPSIFGYLAWYSASDRAEDTGVLAWQQNRPTINPHTERLSTALANIGTGQWLTMPPEAEGGGTLTIEVRESNWLLSDGGTDLSDEGLVDFHGLWSKLDPRRTIWCLMKLPQVEVRKSQPYDNELDTDDVEYKAVINPNAREDIEIETICGTADGGIPMARGVYLKSSDLSQLQSLTRAGRTAQVEELLIGTLYSQFATRHTKLTGTTALLAPALCLWSEAMQPDVRFMLTACAEDPQSDTAEATFVELSPDNFDRASQ